MNRGKGPPEQLLGRLRLLSGGAGSGGRPDWEASSFFLVGMEEGSYPEALDWLAGAIKGRGRLVAAAEPRTGGPATALAREKSGPPGVSREEKSLLWGR